MFLSPDRARAWWRRWRESARGAHHGLDALLARADPREPFDDRLRWLARLTRWLSDPSRPKTLEDASAGRPAQVARVRFLLHVLERNPDWKARFGRTVRSIVRDVDALELYCETGLPRESAFWGEALERLLLKLIPQNPYRAEPGAILAALFPDGGSAAWLGQLDGETLRGLAAAITFEEAPAEAGWNTLARDMPHAVLCLVGEVRAIGLSSPIRRRLGGTPFRDLPFFSLTRVAEEVVQARPAGEEASAETAARLFDSLARCAAAADQVRAHLDQSGVSVKVVYLLERMRGQIRRIHQLLELSSGAGHAKGAAGQFLLALLHDHRRHASVSGLAGENLQLLAQKVVDRSAETGEHYIARTGKDYREMLRAAAGGGALTSFTTWIKFAVLGLGPPPFIQGVLASVNYAVSFVFIQLLHCTLATKQPAMTAPALARRLHGVDTPAGLEALADEVVHLLRSQAAAIFGNVALVIPGVLLLGAAGRFLRGMPLLGTEAAHHTIEHFSLLGPSLLFAAITGILLFLSSLAAGWADNWFVLRAVGDGIAHDPRLVLVFGRRSAARLAAWLGNNTALLAGNVSLGFLLGMTPEIGGFLGLGLDVRHVTLSSGQLAAAAGTLGLHALALPDFWLAVAGIAAIGAANVGVSFGCALWLAIRARGVEAPQRSAIRQVLWRRLRERPGSFLYPTAAPAGT